MSYAHPDALVSGDWLARHLEDPTVRIVDASWYLPTSGRDGRAEFQTRHIPGATFFDVDAIARTDTDLPHMLPDAAAFGAAIGALGIANDHRIIVYDGQGIYSAPRAWWSFRVFGHDDVAVLSGGLAQWLRDGHPVTDAPPDHAPVAFSARYRPELVAGWAELQAHLGQASLDQASLDDRRALVADTRSAGRFAGAEPELRPGVRAGHIPGAVNLHYADILDGAGETFLPAARLRAVFADKGIAADRPVITTCVPPAPASRLASCRLACISWATAAGAPTTGPGPSGAAAPIRRWPPATAHPEDRVGQSGGSGHAVGATA